ncbi:hypothetical protein PG993_006803 [Apiospora rasikravindrae]|uniref:DUF7587 domain-containing protein n=1 Tax=Apiospora rasikravindrae TaxID=990691 RepID=A0ABR1T6P9_9PEZI
MDQEVFVPAIKGDHREHGLQIVLWGPKQVEHAAKPETLAWVVDHEKNHLGRVWAKEPMRAELHDKYDVEVHQEALHCFRGSFVNGRPLIQPSKLITPCLGNARPRVLYRAVHSGQPYNGVCARNYPDGPHPLLFQIQCQKHMNWKWRGPSPFMSATASFKKAKRMCRLYGRMGFEGTKILHIDTTGPGWGSEQQIWHLETMLAEFGVTVKHSHKEEYLITRSIPLQHVNAQDWDQVTRRWLPFSTITEPEEGWLQHERNKVAARQVAEPDDRKEPGDEADGIKQAAGGSKRKRDDQEGDDEKIAGSPRRKGVRAKGFAPLKDKDRVVVKAEPAW